MNNLNKEEESFLLLIAVQAYSEINLFDAKCFVKIFGRIVSFMLYGHCSLEKKFIICTVSKLYE